ncbi:hypothetical protein GCM10009634_31770 [Saccharothrix xinjiangensis]
MLRLAGLSPDAAAELLERALGAAPGAGLRRPAEAAGGNPLFLLEQFRTLDQRQVLRRTGNEVDTSAAVVPPDLRQTLLLRYSFLPETTLDLLRLMAVLGTSCLAAELAAVSGRQAVDLLADLRPALATGVVDGSGERLAFRHEMLRQALYEDVPPAGRRRRGPGAQVARRRAAVREGGGRGDRADDAHPGRQRRRRGRPGPGTGPGEHGDGLTDHHVVRRLPHRRPVPRRRPGRRGPARRRAGHPPPPNWSTRPEPNCGPAAR